MGWVSLNQKHNCGAQDFNGLFVEKFGLAGLCDKIIYNDDITVTSFTF